MLWRALQSLNTQPQRRTKATTATSMRAFVAFVFGCVRCVSLPTHNPPSLTAQTSPTHTHSKSLESAVHQGITLNDVRHCAPFAHSQHQHQQHEQDDAGRLGEHKSDREMHYSTHPLRATGAQNTKQNKTIQQQKTPRSAKD